MSKYLFLNSLFFAKAFKSLFDWKAAAKNIVFVRTSIVVCAARLKLKSGCFWICVIIYQLNSSKQIIELIGLLLS